MRFKNFGGFSLIELIISISISSIIVGVLFSILTNINIIEKTVFKKSHETINTVYAYNLLKNDLSNSLPGIVNGELSVKLKNQNELTINRISLAKNSDLKFKIIKVTWNIENGKLYRNIYEFGDDEKSNEQLIHDFQREINFKIEKESNLLTALKREQKSPSLLSIILGPKNQEIYTFKVGNNL